MSGSPSHPAPAAGKQRLAFLGLGLMGVPMCERLLASGCFELTVWNRTHSTSSRFNHRARVAQTPAEAVAAADVVITMLADGTVVRSVLLSAAVLSCARSGQIFIDMSSSAPEDARALTSALAPLGVDMIDAPVSGGTTGAASGQLTIMAGGSETAIERCASVFEALGTLIRIGPSGTGQAAKMANQAIVGITIGAVAEALLLAQREGADLEAVRSALLGGFASSRVLEVHGRRMIDQAFQPGGKAVTQHKDLTMIATAAKRHALHLPHSALALQQYQSMIRDGMGALDHSGLYAWLKSQQQVAGDLSD